MKQEVEGCLISLQDDGNTEVEITLPNGRKFLVTDSEGNATALAIGLIFGFDKAPIEELNQELISRSLDTTNYI